MSTAIKSWLVQANSIEYGRVTLWVEGEILYWYRDYHFLDENQKALKTPGDDGVGSHLEGSITWDKVPTDIKKALGQIDAFTKAEIDKKEGLL